MLRAGSYLNYSYEMILLLIINALLFIRNHEKHTLQYTKSLLAVTSLYILILFGSNKLIHSHTFNPKQEGEFKRDYLSSVEDRKNILDVINDQLTFFQNPKCAMYYGDANLIYGYDLHFDRMLKSLLGLKVKTKLLFFPTEEYDSYFTDGKVKFIVCENTENHRAGVHEFYPHYQFYKATKRLAIYQFKD
jgi:hypothetical protein